MSIPQIITDACETERDRRYDLTSPFPWGDHIYGTDGRIMARCHIGLEPGITLADGRKVPDLGRIADAPHVERIPADLPEAIGETPCEWCKGTGKVNRYECEHCGETQVLKLDGKPLLIDCNQCDGKGKVPNAEAVKLSDSPRFYLMARYVALLRRHGVRQVMIPARPQGPKLDDVADAATFEGDGFEGWVMPMSTKKVEEDMAREGKLEPISSGV